MYLDPYEIVISVNTNVEGFVFLFPYGGVAIVRLSVLLHRFLACFSIESHTKQIMNLIDKLGRSDVFHQYKLQKNGFITNIDTLNCQHNNKLSHWK